MYKKIILSSLFVLCLIGLISLIKVLNYDDIKLEKICIIVNSIFEDINEERKYVSKTYKIDSSGKDYQIIECVENKNFVYSKLYSNGFTYSVEKMNNNIYIIKSLSETEESKIKIDYIPEQIIEYKNTVLLKNNGYLYYVNFQNKKIDIFESINEIDEKKVVYSNGEILVQNSNKGVCINSFSEKKIVEGKYICLGFLNKDTLILEKELFGGFIFICNYDIQKEIIYNFKVVNIPGYILNAACSPDGKNLIYLTSNGEGSVETYILSLDSYKKKRINIDIECVNTIQWFDEHIDNTGNGTACLVEE